VVPSGIQSEALLDDQITQPIATHQKTPSMNTNTASLLRKLALCLSASILTLTAILPAHAATYVLPVDVTSTPNNANPSWTASNLLLAPNPYFSNNGAGLNTGDQVGLVGDLPTYSSMEDGGGSAQYRPSSVTATLIFDLGNTYSLNGLRLWNYAEYWGGATYNDRGVKDFTLSFSTDGGTTFSNAQNFTAAIGGGAGGLPLPNRSAGQAFSFGDISANFVKFDITSSQGSTFSSGIAALRFTAVPEPSTYALVLGGIATLLLIRRRVQS
jgi:hypothetical protein